MRTNSSARRHDPKKTPRRALRRDYFLRRRERQPRENRESAASHATGRGISDSRRGKRGAKTPRRHLLQTMPHYKQCITCDDEVLQNGAFCKTIRRIRYLRKNSLCACVLIPHNTALSIMFHDIICKILTTMSNIL